MAKNDFKPFATGEHANVLSQADYEALDATANGFQTGIARSEQLNKVWRQASTIASVVASFMADKSGNDVLDNGDTAALQATLLKALLNNATSQLDGRYLQSGKNLADLNNVAQARGNLGLGSLALKNGLSAAEVGAFPVTGGEVKGEVWSNSINNYRIIANNKGFFWRFDGENYYLMLTKDGDPRGGWNDLRPFIVSASNGNVETGTSLKVGGNFTCANVVYSGNGASWMATDGNIYGGIWGGYLSNWVNSQINNVNNYINGNFVRDFRLGGLESTNVANATGYTDQPPYVITGVYNFNSDNIVDILYRRPMQKYINGTWYNVGSA